MVEQGVLLTPDLGRALFNGTSIGGARPKATITSDGTEYVAKFWSANDIYNVAKVEFIAMHLASKVGLEIVPVSLRHVAGKDLLLVKRFDRVLEENGTRFPRKATVSALTPLELDKMMARYSSDKKHSTIVRHRLDAPKHTLRRFLRVCCSTFFVATRMIMLAIILRCQITATYR